MFFVLDLGFISLFGRDFKYSFWLYLEDVGFFVVKFFAIYSMVEGIFIVCWEVETIIVYVVIYFVLFLMSFLKFRSLRDLLWRKVRDFLFL